MCDIKVQYSRPTFSRCQHNRYVYVCMYVCYIYLKILDEKIRLRKPLLQPFDGPYNRTNSWLKQFYWGEKHYWASNNG